MKKIVVIAIIALVLIGGGFYYFMHDKTEGTKVTTPNSSQTITEKIASDNGQLVDVRTPEEFNTSHAKDAINVPLADIQKGDYSKIDKNRAVYVYCRSGNRSTQAKIVLDKAGYRVINIGGLQDFKNQGGTVIVY